MSNTTNLLRRKFFFGAIFSAIFALPIYTQTAPPTAEVRNVRDEYWGVKVVDPYRWMEDLKANEMQKWMKGQADYADAYLKKLSSRADFLKRFEELSAGRIAVGGVKRFGSRFYYFRRAAGESVGKIMMREVDADGAEKVLFDLDKISIDGGKNYQIGYYVPSPDGRLLAYEIYADGNEDGEIRVLEIATGKDLGVRIGNKAKPQSWLPDSKSFTYARFEEQPANAKPEQKEEKKRVRLHRLGSDAKNDREIFGYQVNPEIEFPLINDYAVKIPPGSKYAFGMVNPGVTTNDEFYFAPVAALEAKAAIPWRKIGGLADEVYAGLYKGYVIGARGDDLYLITTKNAPRGKVIRLDLKNPNLAQAETIFADAAEIIYNIRAAKGALYVQTINGGTSKLRRIDYQTKKQQVIEIPAGGSIFEMNADAVTDGLIFGTDSWVKTETFLSFNAKTNQLLDARLAVPSKIDASNIEVVQAYAKSHDGAMIPLVIVHKKGLPLNGTNPTLLDGYGSFGTNNLEPVFSSRRLAWLERGGVLAFAGVRGGGEYGEEWRLGGFQKTKANTWKDFIACTELLIEKKYTAPAHLAGRGASVGGILINNAIVERPDLFAAAIVSVGLSNTIRFETTSNGASGIVEYGSVKTEEGFKSLLAMDAYHKVKTGVKYPAVLFTHGANDQRVEPWLSAKMAARLQAATTSGKPVLLRINYEGGHFGGSNVRQANELQADIYAFLFEQLK